MAITTEEITKALISEFEEVGFVYNQGYDDSFNFHKNKSSSEIKIYFNLSEDVSLNFFSCSIVYKQRTVSLVFTKTNESIKMLIKHINIVLSNLEEIKTIIETKKEIRFIETSVKKNKKKYKTQYRHMDNYSIEETGFKKISNAI